VAAYNNSIRIGTVCRDVEVHPFKRCLYVVNLVRIVVWRQAVADHGGRNSIRRERTRNVAVVRTVAFDESAAVNENKDRAGWLASWEIQIELLFQIFAVGDIQMMSQFIAGRGRQVIGRVVESDPVDAGARWRLPGKRM
jgi:hypothetical protein